MLGDSGRSNSRLMDPPSLRAGADRLGTSEGHPGGSNYRFGSSETRLGTSEGIDGRYGASGMGKFGASESRLGEGRFVSSSSGYKLGTSDRLSESRLGGDPRLGGDSRQGDSKLGSESRLGDLKRGEPRLGTAGKYGTEGRLGTSDHRGYLDSNSRYGNTDSRTHTGRLGERGGLDWYSSVAGETSPVERGESRLSLGDRQKTSMRQPSLKPRTDKRGTGDRKRRDTEKDELREEEEDSKRLKTPPKPNKKRKRRNMINANLSGTRYDVGKSWIGVLNSATVYIFSTHV